MGSLINPLRRFALPSFLNFGYIYTLWIILAYVPLYLTDIGFSHLQISVLISIFPLSSLAFVSNLFLPERIGGNLGVLDITIFTATFVSAITSGAIPGYVLPFVFTGSLAILALPVTMSVRPKF